MECERGENGRGKFPGESSRKESGSCYPIIIARFVFFTSKPFLKLVVIFHKGLAMVISDSLVLLWKILFLSNVV